MHNNSDRQPPPTKEEFDMLLNPYGDDQDFFSDYVQGAADAG